tara:strand:- start:38 stop:1045 length:1008 start_codon:yes stop_codon:yes gene_type:complete
MLNYIKENLKKKLRLCHFINRFTSLSTQSENIERRIQKLEDMIEVQNKLIVNCLSHTEGYQKLVEAGELNELEFKVSSQWGDDGVIQYIVSQLKDIQKSFVEFGVEDYKESNTRFLLHNNNWKGLIIDSSVDNINNIKSQSLYWRYQLTAVEAFITEDNINSLISENSDRGDIGILSIDIDGNDYWIWKAITVVQPWIVIVEYNSILGVDSSITIPYQKDFNRFEAHYSGLYFGASLKAFYELAQEKGYEFLGTTSNGNNAYFVRSDKIKGSLRSVSLEKGFNLAQLRESRNIDGEKSYVGEEDRQQLISEMEFWNIDEQKLSLFKDLSTGLNES